MMRHCILFSAIQLLLSTSQQNVCAFMHTTSIRSLGQRSLIPTTSSPTSKEHIFRMADENAEDVEEAPQEEEKAQVDSTDILNSPAFLKRKIDVLKSDIAAVDEKIEASNTIYEANKAEWGPQFEDLRKELSLMTDRLAKQSSAGKEDATVDVARKLLDTLDNFDRAFGVVTPETDADRVVEASYKETYDMILKTMNSLGVEECATVGTEFDYEVHQAIMTKPSEDYEEGIVCEELAKGFKMKDGKLIRAAMVVVAA